MPRPTYVWTEALISRACAMAETGMAHGEIAAQLGLSAQSIHNKFTRLRAAGDPRAPARAPTTREAVAGLEPIDAVAEVIARGAPDLTVAASRLGMSPTRARHLWQQVVQGRGTQAI